MGDPSFRLFVDNHSPQHITYFPLEERFIFAVDDLTSGTYLLAMAQTTSSQWEVEGYSTPSKAVLVGRTYKTLRLLKIGWCLRVISMFLLVNQSQKTRLVIH